MIAASEGDGGIRPRFAPHVRLRYDALRSRWVVQAPERLLVLDDVALAILQRCDGRSIDEIVNDLATTFDAPREEITQDVGSLIEDLQRRGILVS